MKSLSIPLRSYAIGQFTRTLDQFSNADTIDITLTSDGWPDGPCLRITAAWAEGGGMSATFNGGYVGKDGTVNPPRSLRLGVPVDGTTQGARRRAVSAVTITADVLQPVSTAITATVT